MEIVEDVKRYLSQDLGSSEVNVSSIQGITLHKRYSSNGIAVYEAYYDSHESYTALLLGYDSDEGAHLNDILHFLHDSHYKNVLYPSPLFPRESGIDQLDQKKYFFYPYHGYGTNNLTSYNQSLAFTAATTLSDASVQSVIVDGFNEMTTLIDAKKMRTTEIYALTFKIERMQKEYIKKLNKVLYERFVYKDFDHIRKPLN